MKIFPADILGCRQGSGDANGTALCGSIYFGQFFGTADSFRCCEHAALSDHWVCKPLGLLKGTWACMSGCEVWDF